jgi:hypothetical protein
MHIEDLIFSLAIGNLKLNKWDLQIIDSLHDQVCQSTGLTEKQCSLAIRIIKRYSSNLSAYHKTDIMLYVDNPKYRLPIRKSITSKTIRIIDDPIYKKVIEAKFPYNESIITTIRNYRNKNESAIAAWDKDKSAWIFSLTEQNIVFIINSLPSTEFEYDDEFKKYADKISDIISNMEDHVPILVSNEGVCFIKNASPYMPKLAATNFLEAVFHARLLGVNMWDNQIESFLESTEVDEGTRNFLKTDMSVITSLKSIDGGVHCLKNIIKYLGPCLFIVPGVDELPKLEQIYTIVTEMGIDAQNMSVLFRLDSDSGSKFNEFVKNKGLNNPVTEDTKIAFVSGKLPKPLVKSNVRFNSIINLGFTNAHYTLKNYVKNHQNLVFFDVSPNKKEFDFVNL